jgi:hypothetical protein
MKIEFTTIKPDLNKEQRAYSDISLKKNKKQLSESWEKILNKELKKTLSDEPNCKIKPDDITVPTELIMEERRKNELLRNRKTIGSDGK